MEEILKEFLEWMPDNLDDIFELVDEPEKVIKRYIEETQQCYFIIYIMCQPSFLIAGNVDAV